MRRRDVVVPPARRRERDLRQRKIAVPRIRAPVDGGVAGWVVVGGGGRRDWVMREEEEGENEDGDVGDGEREVVVVVVHGD